MPSVKKLNVQINSMNGAVVYQGVSGYENGKIPMNNLTRGTYVLTITSSDRKYQYTKKIIKN
jgi:PII-like signaling protein